MAIWTRNSGAMSTNNSYIKYRTKVVLNSQNITNNTSNITVSVEVWRTNSGYTTFGTGTAYLIINGTSYSNSITTSQKFSHNSYTQVISKTVNVSHGSDGTKSLGVSARIAHSQFSSSNQSYSTSLNTIPRGSSLSAFSFATYLYPDREVKIKYTVDRKSSGFRHQIRLLDGSHLIQEWDNINSNGASELTLSTAKVNSLLRRINTSTSKALTLRVATRSGHNGGWIGSAVARNANINIHSTVVPTIGELSISQTGNSVSNHILQGMSKITASFTRSAGYGASVSNSTITVRRKGNNDDVQTINSNSGTTGRAITHSGTYQAQGMVRDSRGRTAYTAWTDISVEAYSPPRITTFTATRYEWAPTYVDIVRNTVHTNLGTSNPLTYKVQRRQGAGNWYDVNSNTTGSYYTSPLTNGSSFSMGNNVALSYEFRLVITDGFNNSAESIVSVSTQRVVLDVHKNEGVGIGKIHEEGVLDVDGDVFTNGRFIITPGKDDENKSNPIIINSRDANGHGYIEWVGSDNVRKAYAGISTTNTTAFTIMNESGGDLNLRTLGNGKLLFNGTQIIESGSNSNGEWIKFGDGTMICTFWEANQISVSYSRRGTYYRAFYTDYFPQRFNSDPVVITDMTIGIDGGMTTATTMVERRTTSLVEYVMLADDSRVNTILKRGYIAIGRWK